MTAAKEAKVAEVPAMIYFDLSEEEMRTIALLENEMREAATLKDTVWAIVKFSQELDAGVRNDKSKAVKMIALKSGLPFNFINRYYGIVALVNTISMNLIEDSAIDFSVVLQMTQYDLTDKKVLKALSEYCAEYIFGDQDRSNVNNLNNFMRQQTDFSVRYMKNATWNLDIAFAGKPACKGCAFNGLENPLMSDSVKAICGSTKCFDAKASAVLLENAITVSEVYKKVAQKLDITTTILSFDNDDRPEALKNSESTSSVNMIFCDEARDYFGLPDSTNAEDIIKELNNSCEESFVDAEEVVERAKKDPDSPEALLVNLVEIEIAPLVNSQRNRGLQVKCSIRQDEIYSDGNIEQEIQDDLERTIDEAVEELRTGTTSWTYELDLVCLIDSKLLAEANQLLINITEKERESQPKHNGVMKPRAADRPAPRNEQAEKIDQSIDRANKYIESIDRLIAESRMESLRPRKDGGICSTVYAGADCVLIGEPLQDWEDVLIRAIIYDKIVGKYRFDRGMGAETLAKAMGISTAELKELDGNTIMLDDRGYAIVAREFIKQTLIDGMKIDPNGINGAIYSTLLSRYNDPDFVRNDNAIITSYNEKLNKKKERLEELKQELLKANEMTPVIQPDDQQEEEIESVEDMEFQEDMEDDE